MNVSAGNGAAPGATVEQVAAVGCPLCLYHKVVLIYAFNASPETGLHDRRELLGPAFNSLATSGRMSLAYCSRKYGEQ